VHEELLGGLSERDQPARRQLQAKRGFWESIATNWDRTVSWAQPAWSKPDCVSDF